VAAFVNKGGATNLKVEVKTLTFEKGKGA